MIKVNEVKNKVDLLGVVEGELGTRAREAKGWAIWPCPFHAGHEFGVNGGGWRCKGGLAGDLLSWLMLRRQWSFQEAEEWVGAMSQESGGEAGVDMPKNTAHQSVIKVIGWDGVGKEPGEAWRYTIKTLEMDLLFAGLISTFRAYARPLVLRAVRGDVFVVEAPNAFIREWVDARLKRQLERILAGSANRSVEIEFVIGGAL